MSILETAAWTNSIQPSMLYRLARWFGSNPDMISLAGGVPDPELCPTEALVAATTDVMLNEPRSLQYGKDLDRLKRQIVELMAMRGVTCEPEQVSITASAQHAMDVLTRLFMNQGDQVMLEELVYSGIQQTVMPFQPDLLTIPVDSKTGLDVDVVEKHLKAGAKPAFLYTIAESHNPLSVSLSRQKRIRLVELAQQYNFPLIEDDAYGFLSYDEDAQAPLIALDSERVFYVGSFAKLIAPGLRLGWIVSPRAFVHKITVTKRLALLSVTPLAQYIVTNYLKNNDFPAHLALLRKEYGYRRDRMLQAMEEHFPKEITWNKPAGGMFIWAELPKGFDTEELVYRAAEEVKVGYIPGKAFITDKKNTQGEYDHCMRLTFVRYDASILCEGIARLGGFLKKIIGEETAT